MSIIKKVRELSKEVKTNIESSGIKEKAKGISLTAVEVIGEGVSDLGSAVNKGRRSLEKKYEQNLKKVQSAKISKDEATRLVEELERLAALKDKGALTEKEFEIAKARLLKRK